MAADPSSGELAAWLDENREPLLRRFLDLVVRRSSLEELAERPFADRMRELDLMLEAARAEAASARATSIESVVSERIARQEPFALALFAHPDGDDAGWDEVIEAAGGQRALGDGGGAVALVIDAATPREARIAADGIRAGAWQGLGGRGALPDAGVALYPADATDADALLALARTRLAASAEPVREEPHPVDDRPPAPVTPLYPL